MDSLIAIVCFFAVMRLGKKKEKLSDNMKIAIFTNMLPGNLQDYVYMHTEKDCKYEDVREKVGALVGNKVAASTGPTPMDVGDVRGGAWRGLVLRLRGAVRGRTRG